MTILLIFLAIVGVAAAVWYLAKNRGQGEAPRPTQEPVIPPYKPVQTPPPMPSSPITSLPKAPEPQKPVPPPPPVPPLNPPMPPGESSNDPYKI